MHTYGMHTFTVRPMRTDAELKAMQDAYWARPVTVRWTDSHYSCTEKFLTIEEALAYVQYQWVRIKKETSERRFCASRLYHSYIETPAHGRVSLRYWLLADDVSSY